MSELCAGDIAAEVCSRRYNIVIRCGVICAHIVSIYSTVYLIPNTIWVSVCRYLYVCTLHAAKTVFKRAAERWNETLVAEKLVCCGWCA